MAHRTRKGRRGGRHRRGGGGRRPLRGADGMSPDLSPPRTAVAHGHPVPGSSGAWSEKPVTPAERRIEASAPVRICDNGGWTDTWFGGPGRIVNIAAAPGVEVSIRARPGRGQVLLHVKDFGDRYPVVPGRPRVARHALLEAAVDALPPPEGADVEIALGSAVPARLRHRHLGIGGGGTAGRVGRPPRRAPVAECHCLLGPPARSRRARSRERHPGPAECRTGGDQLHRSRPLPRGHGASPAGLGGARTPVDGGLSRSTPRLFVLAPRGHRSGDPGIGRAPAVAGGRGHVPGRGPFPRPGCLRSGDGGQHRGPRIPLSGLGGRGGEPSHGAGGCRGGGGVEGQRGRWERRFGDRPECRSEGQGVIRAPSRRGRRPVAIAPPAAQPHRAPGA